jgi:hypothetical protein
MMSLDCDRECVWWYHIESGRFVECKRVVFERKRANGKDEDSRVVEKRSVID